MGSRNKFLTIHIHWSSESNTFQFGILWGKTAFLQPRINPRGSTFSSSLLSWLLNFALAARVWRQSGSKLVSEAGVFKPVSHQKSQEQMFSHNSLKSPSTNIIFPVTYSGLSDWMLFPYLMGLFAVLTLTKILLVTIMDFFLPWSNRNTPRTRERWVISGPAPKG